MESATARPDVSLWWEAARPRTLPASVAPVVVGTAASTRLGIAGSLDLLAFVLALTVALALQVAVNYANDYFDGTRGVDTAERVGPRRAVASGLVDAPSMRRAMVIALGVAGLAGFVLSAMVGWELLLVGALALLAAVGYSGGPRPYASAGMGELFVFVFFGVIATVGSAYVQDGGVQWLATVASLPMGLLATALLVVNNLRDIPTDREVGKVTLAVRLGELATRRLYLVLVAGAYAVVVLLMLGAGHGWYALPLLSVPLAWRGLELVRHAPLGPRLIAALAYTARAQLVFAVLFAVALLLRTELP